MGGDKENLEYIVDASVLIDYCKINLSLLAIFSKEIGTVYIPTPIIHEEVSQLTIPKARKHHLKPIEPKIEQLMEAEALGKQTSFYDNLCFILARDNGYTCITNDKPLKRLCENYNVPSIWGLEMMVMLVNKGKITKRKAVNCAFTIQKYNPFITNEIIQRFKDKISY